MKYTIGVAMLAAVAILAVGACRSGGGGSDSGGNANKGKDLFTSKQCTTCHTLSAVPAAVGVIGPPLNGIATTAASRVPNQTAEVYLRTSMKTPDAFIVPGFPGPPSLMVLPVPVTDAEINDLVAFLLTQK